jgi:glucose-1-phosphate thymidylyltransferase
MSQIDGRVVVEEGATIERSHIRGPVIIGRRTQVVESFIGPFTAIDADCEIHHSEIEHSVILSRSRIHDAGRLEDSLLGRDVEVNRTQRRPRATRLMVGDHCQIDLT